MAIYLAVKERRLRRVAFGGRRLPVRVHALEDGRDSIWCPGLPGLLISRTCRGYGRRTRVRNSHGTWCTMWIPVFPVVAIDMGKETYECDAPELKSTESSVEGVKDELPAAPCGGGPFISWAFEESSGRDYVGGNSERYTHISEWLLKRVSGEGGIRYLCSATDWSHTHSLRSEVPYAVKRITPGPLSISHHAAAWLWVVQRIAPDEIEMCCDAHLLILRLSAKLETASDWQWEQGNSIEVPRCWVCLASARPVPDSSLQVMVFSRMAQL